jgi:PmbA protein
MTRLEKIALAALEKAKRAGADLADVSVSAGSSRQVEIKDNKISAVTAHQAREVTIRAVVGRKIGFYRLHSLTEDDVRTGAVRAVEIAGSSEPDPDFHDLPHPEQAAGTPKGLSDPAVENLDLATLRTWALDNVSSAVDSVAGVRISGVTGAYVSRGVIVNTNGVSVSEEGTILTLDFFAVIRRKDDAGSYFAFSEARDLGGVSPAGVALKAARQAEGFLGAQDIAPGKYTVMLAPLASYDFLRHIAHAANAEEHQRKRSFLSGRVGETVMPEFMNITDDPLVDKGIYSGPYDGEGAARKRVKIISEGKLTGLLHSSYTAGKAGAENNGHGGRTGSVYPTNLVPSLGKRSHKEMLSDVEDGVMLLAGSLDPDPITGEVSSLLDFAMKIEKGRVVYPLRSVTAADKILPVFGNIAEVSADYEELPGNPMPYMLIDGMNLVGAA